MGCSCDRFRDDLVDSIVMNAENSPLLQDYTQLPNREGCYQHTPPKGQKYYETNCYGFAIHTRQAKFVDPSAIEYSDFGFIIRGCEVENEDISRMIEPFKQAIKTDSEREREATFTVEHLGADNPQTDCVTSDGSVDIIAGALQQKFSQTAGNPDRVAYWGDYHWWRYINKPEIEQGPPQVGWYHKPGNSFIRNFDNSAPVRIVGTPHTQKEPYTHFLGYFKVTKN
jgi:hypothetical protein